MNENRYRNVVGFDVGVHAVKAVLAAQQGREIVFSQPRRAVLPPDEGGQARVLKHLVEEMGWCGVPCVVAVRGESVMLRAIRIETGDPRSVDAIADAEVEELKDLHPDETVRQWLRQGETPGGQSVLLAAARLEAVAGAYERASVTGLDVIDVVSGASAAHYAVHRLCRRQSQSIVCADIGHGSSQIVMSMSGKVLVARHLPFGAGARAVPEKAGPASGAAAKGLAPEASGRERWIEELQQCLALYAGDAPRDKPVPDRIVLCGGGSLATGFRVAVENATGIETALLGELWNPPGIHEPELFATAAGLAMTHLRRGKAVPSLLPPAVSDKRALRQRKKYWVLSALLLVLAMIVVTAGMQADLRSAGNMLTTLERERDDLVDLKRAVDRCRRANANLEKQILPFRALVHSGEVLRALIHAVGRTKHPDDWVVLMADAESYGRGGAASGMPVEAGAAATETHERDALRLEQIVVEGYTPAADLSTVRTMIEALRSSPGIVEVDLLGDDRMRKDEARDRRWADTGCTVFAIEVTVTGS